MLSCVHHQFEEQVEKTPKAIAVALDDEFLSYETLNFRANQLARYLKTIGVRGNDLVAVCLEFGLDLAVALLGVLKAGAAYVPLDPGYPEERIACINEQTKSTTLLTQARLNRLGRLFQTSLCLDAHWSDVAAHSWTNLPRTNSLDDLVYCIFTSGSTGTPKGALNLHRGFANLCQWYSGPDACGGAGARTMIVSSVGFDLTQKNIFEPLVSGGLVIFGTRRVGDLDHLAAAVRRYRPTRINCAPSSFDVLKSVLYCDSLRLIVLGGEPVGAALAQEIIGRGVRLMNSYGPTECSDVAMYHVGFAGGEDTVPLGRPIPSVKLYLVDANNRLIEGAGLGELYIGGVGVGRGYVGRVDLTAERFIADGFHHGSGRIYRTGDLVCRMRDGTMRYVGRTDHQVKISGTRIEPGEIEAVLMKHNGVAGAAVAFCETRSGNKRLAAFVVAKPGVAGVSESDLRAYLARRLPATMIPTAWRFPERLPLTAHGKIDRLALRDAATGGVSAESCSIEAVTPTEKMLVDIWRETLEAQDVGVEDDFLALGGDSLSALRSLMTIRERLSRDVTLETIYAKRTIRALARVLDTSQPKGAREKPISRRPQPEPIAGGYEFAPSLSQVQDLRKPAGAFSFLKNFGFGVRVYGRLDIESFVQAVSSAIMAQEALRTSFRCASDGTVVGKVATAAAAKVDLFDLSDTELGRGSNACAEMMSIIRQSSFDVSAAPLLRCAVGRRSDEDFICSFNLHHAIADAWSMSVLTREIGNAYARLRGGRPADHGRTRRFSDFVAQEHEAAARGAFRAKEGFWRDTLWDLPERIAIPLAVSTRPTAFSYAADAVSFEFNAEFTCAMRSFCARLRVTPYMVLLTCLFALINRHTGEEDLYIRSPASNRLDQALADVIGPLGAAIVVRVAVAKGIQLFELLQRVRVQVLAAHANLGLPPPMFAACVRPNEDPAFGSRFQITYNHHNYPSHPPIWGELKLVSIEEEFRYIKADMVLHSWFAGDRLLCALAFYTGILARSDAECLVEDFRAITAELVCDGLA